MNSALLFFCSLFSKTKMWLAFAEKFHFPRGNFAKHLKVNRLFEQKLQILAVQYAGHTLYSCTLYMTSEPRVK